MIDFVEEVRDKYEKIVFDCPPVSAVSDPLIIAANTDGTVFVNKFNKIRREHARKTVQRVQDAGINIVGVASTTSISRARIPTTTPTTITRTATTPVATRVTSRRRRGCPIAASARGKKAARRSNLPDRLAKR